jgi:class 3 adenylate cyclase
MSSSNGKFRFDAEIEFQEYDEVAGVVSFAIRPNPDRYESVDRDGRQWLYDRYDAVYIPLEVLESLAAQMSDTFKAPLNPTIADAASYTLSRIEHIQRMLSETSTSYSGPHSPSEEILQRIGPRQHEFVFVSVDVIGSTARWTSGVSEQVTAKVIGVLQNELTSIVPCFHGSVLNTTGDGFIAYFPAPNFIIKNDLAFDCALTMIRLVVQAINPTLVNNEIDPIEIRIGIESGNAHVQTVGNSEAGQKLDILGSVPSLAAKIQSCAPPMGIGIGETAERNLHSSWRRQIDRENKVSLPYNKRDTGESYSAFFVLPKFT